MYLDADTRFSNAQAITATANSTNIVDLGNSTYERVNHDQVIHGHVPTSFDNLTSLAVGLVTATDEAFSSPVTLGSRSFTLAQLVAGLRFNLPLPREGVKRYLRLSYTVTGANPSAGAISAWLMPRDSIHSNGFRDA